MNKYLKISMQFGALLVFFALLATVNHFIGHTATGVTMAWGMLGAQDMRIAYTNAYRTMWNKATNNGANKTPSWLPNQGNKILSQSDLITEVLVSGNKTQYLYGINTNQAQNGQPIYNTERRLNLQDTFFVAGIGYYFRMVQTAGGNTSYQSHLYTHIPGFFFGAIDQYTGDNLWNGNLQLSVNNRTVVPEWDLWRHYNVPMTQYPNWSTFSPTALYPVNDETYGDQAGMYPCEPMWILDGSYDNTLTVSFNNQLNTIIGNNTIHMVVVMRGILAQNCGKIMEPGLLNPGA